jgi:NitT/TauT family transport system ATP-binding protein/sulfonate transport system ATP-binding protein
MARGPGLDLSINLLQFGGRVLFEGFHLHAAPGETLALIGPSGVGKSTLIRILAGVEHGFDGHALIEGKPAAQAPRPGLVFQDARLLPWASCAQNLTLVRPEASADMIATALAAVGLAGVEQDWPRQLSGGMQRRLGLARALLVNPQLLLLDEPFVSLDRAVVRDLQTLVAGLIAHSRATAVLVSHDPGDAARLAHRVVVLGGRPARIVADLTLDQAPGQRSREMILACENRIEASMLEAAL